MSDWTYDQALERVEREPALWEHEDLILYDWTELNDHLRWVCTAPVDEIVAWARYLRRYLDA